MTKSKIIENVILADTIMADFNERGLAADFVYYEVLELVETWNNQEEKTDDLLDYLSFTMGFDGKKHFGQVLARAKRITKEIESMLDGTFNPDETE